MEQFSEVSLKKNCPHCDPNSYALKHILKETENFWIVCDVHPIVEGHILIIPKNHLSCIGEYPVEIFKEFLILNKDVTDFLLRKYKKVSSFEHGKIAQTVFHSHVHYFPFHGSLNEIIWEGDRFVRKITSIDELYSIFQRDEKYLFFSIENDKWVVDTKISQPRFFRDRFAIALKVPKRGNWKEMHEDKKLMTIALKDIRNTVVSWKEFHQT